MLRAEEPVLYIEGLAEQPLRFGVMAFLHQNNRQIGHGNQGVRILWPEDLTLDIERLAIQFLRFSAMTFVPQNSSQIFIERRVSGCRGPRTRR